jgi:Protein of unknown function (DUF1064)
MLKMAKNKRHRFTAEDIVSDGTGGFVRNKTVSAPRNKYKNVQVWLSDGAPVDYTRLSNGTRTRINRPGDVSVRSKKERKRYLQLIELQTSGAITNFEHEPVFWISKTLRINGVTYPKRKFKPDFQFDTVRDVVIENILIPANTHVILEEKSKETIKETAYRLRKHIFLEKYVDGNENIVFIEMVK